MIQSTREIEVEQAAGYLFAGRITANLPILIGLACACSAATFGVVLAFPAGSFARAIFLEAPAITAVQTLLFFLGLALLLRKRSDLHFEQATLRTPLGLLSGGGPEGSIDRNDAGTILGRLGELRPRVRKSVVVNRIDKSLRRLHITGSTRELGTILHELAGLDQERFDSGHTMIRFLLAVIPIVGFIGTVLGISYAIGGFPAMMQGKQGVQALQEPITRVTADLGLAFNTTFLALVQAGVLMFFQSLVQRGEDAFLGDVNEYCIDEILNRVRMESEGVQFKEAIEREMQDLRLVMAEQNEDMLLALQGMLGGSGGGS